jgi:hypothetical protein
MFCLVVIGITMVLEDVFRVNYDDAVCNLGAAVDIERDERDGLIFKTDLIENFLSERGLYNLDELKRGIRECAIYLGEDKSLMRMYGVDSENVGEVCVNAAMISFVREFGYNLWY